MKSLHSKQRLALPSLPFLLCICFLWHMNQFVFCFQEVDRNIRKMYEVMDYADPEPNVNPRTGYIFTPPPQPN